MKILVLGLFLGYIVGYALAAGAQTTPPSTSVEAFLKLDEDDQAFYAGAAYGMLRAVVQAHREGVNLAGNTRLSQCLLEPSGRLYAAGPGQLRAIVTQYVNNNPANWGFGLPAMTIGAVLAACR